MHHHGTVQDDTLTTAEGRTVAFADFGPGDGAPVLWCHGGPGCRLDPAYVAADAAAAGLRLIGIDRPGYGGSDPQPGRTIAGWVADALAVADRLGIERFVTVGLSTGGAYALATAALAPERVAGAVPCCSLTDTRYEPARATMSRPHTLSVWEAPDRESAIAAAVASHGVDGSRIMAAAEEAGLALPACDQAMLPTPWGRAWMAHGPVMFAHGVEGYADDRIADRDGWAGFAVQDVRCPVVILHGADDVLARPVHARHTAELIPHADLRILAGHGHFSIEDELVPVLAEVAAAGGLG
jgi:pimeloyl-ACP methyl ester carboxylesterase